MNTPHYVIFDTETGGIGIDKSLLTAYFLVTDKDFNSIADLTFYLKPDDDIYRVVGEAMAINQINLVDHEKIAIPYKKGGTTLYEFLKTNSNDGKIKLVPVGHGMSFDLDHIWDKLIGRSTWESFVSYRRLDTSIALQFLKSCGLFPETVSGSLESLVKYFNIKQTGRLHSAVIDTLLTRDVLKAMIGNFGNLKPLTQ